MPTECTYVYMMVATYFVIFLLPQVTVYGLSILDLHNIQRKAIDNPSETHRTDDLVYKLEKNKENVQTVIDSADSNTNQSYFHHNQDNIVKINLPTKSIEMIEQIKHHKIRRKDKKSVLVEGKRSRRQRRHFRNHPEGLFKRRSCQTKSRYNYKEEATDMFGNVVKVYPYIHIGSLSIDQYFYESFCDVEKCECSGIDDKKFRSSCETDYSFTYARVVKNGEIGWTHIKIRSGCSCVIHNVNSSRAINIVDLI